MKASFKVISLASNTIERVNKFIESGDLFRNSGQFEEALKNYNRALSVA